jgi:RNA polymerase-binding transcription factor DksA
MNIREIENISGLKIRFVKFLQPALKYFNIEDDIEKLNIDNSIKLVEFINSSNSKLSESYWILRTDLDKKEYDKYINVYKENFIKSAYSKTNRRNVQRKFNKKNFSRGYSGWLEINGIKYYCRSKNEFIYMQYLNKLYPVSEGFKILTENKIFYIDDFSYKPDIFIYYNDILIKIYEIKGKYDVVDNKYEKFSKYFKEINIDYEIVKNSVYILKTNLDIKNKLIEWLKTEASINVSVSGELNPRYGVKCSDKTKDLIKNKAKERCKDKNYIKMMSESAKLSYINNPELSKNISERQKKRYNKNHYKICGVCGKEFYIENLRINRYMKTCNDEKCLKEYRQKSSYIKKIIEYSKIIFDKNNDITYDEYIIELNKIKSKNFNINYSTTINKYFGSFEKLKEIVYENK